MLQVMGQAWEGQLRMVSVDMAATQLSRRPHMEATRGHSLRHMVSLAGMVAMEDTDRIPTREVAGVAVMAQVRPFAEIIVWK